MAEPRGESCLLPGDGHYGEPGPYEVGTMNATVGELLRQYTIFYPVPFQENCKHPIVAWGNATGVGGTEKYEFLNANAASWGLVVIAAHTPNAYDPAPFTMGIDWLLAQNEDPASIFHGKLSARAGVAAHEQGGVGASLSATHPNVEAVVAAMANANPMLGPRIAYACLTGNEDVLSNSYCTKAFETAAGPAFLASWHGADFFAPTREQYEMNNPASFAVQRLYAAWMRCFLADDATACAMFRGEPCGMCGEEGWARIEGRNL